MKSVIVTTKDELKSAKDAKADEIIAEGKLAKDLRTASVILKLSPAAIFMLSMAIAAATVTAPATGGLSIPVAQAIAAPIAVKSGLDVTAAVVAVSVIGVPVLVGLNKGYDIEYNYLGARVRFTKKR